MLRRAWLAFSVLFGLASHAAGQDVRVSAIPSLGWRPVVAVAGVVGVAMLFDHALAEEVVTHSTAGSRATARTLDRFGEVEVIAPVVGGLALAGVVAGQPKLTRTSGQVVLALVTATILTQPAKYLFGRRRPYQDSTLDAMDWSPFSGRTSFPSGHTAAAFALATTLGDASGNTAAKVALYGLAAGTAWGRVTESNHWLSDVLAGGAVGVLSAKFASGRVRLLGLRAPRILMGGGRTGVAMTASLPLIR
jgi:membrane-associated phospholipid phosphatase